MKTEDTVFAWLRERFGKRLVTDLVGIEGARVEVLPVDLPLVRTLQADVAVRVHRPAPKHVLHLEHWSSRGRLARTVLYHMWYHDATGLPVRTVIVTTDRRLRAAVPKAYRFRVGRGTPTQVPLGTLHLWKMRAAEVLARRRVALYPFVPVMQDPRPPKALLGELRDRIMEDAENERDRGTLLSGAAFIAVRRFPVALVEAVFGGLEEMAKTDWGQQLMNRGAARQARVDVLSALEVRFGSVPEALKARINGIEDEAKLTELHRLAVTAANLAEFEAGL